MHPSELKNQALAAAAMAERDGFASTAEAFKLLAIACATEARDLLGSSSEASRRNKQSLAPDQVRNFEFAH
jgi:hypothetical protein